MIVSSASDRPQAVCAASGRLPPLITPSGVCGSKDPTGWAPEGAPHVGVVEVDFLLREYSLRSLIRKSP